MGLLRGTHIVALRSGRIDRDLDEAIALGLKVESSSRAGSHSLEVVQRKLSS